MKKVLTGLLLTLLIFTNCRRKSSNSITTSNQNDTTTDMPPGPTGSTQDSTNSQSLDTTAAKTALKFTFLPDKQNLEAGNIGFIYKEDNANILSVYVNICGGNNVFGVTFDLNYDGTKLKLKSVIEGDFLKRDGNLTDFESTNSIIVVTRVGQVSGMYGNGTICIIELEAKKTFDSQAISFKNQTVINSQGIKVIPDANWFGGILGYK